MNYEDIGTYDDYFHINNNLQTFIFKKIYIKMRIGEI